ncbi:MAG: secretin and TonB N-terminal domain-containing protein [Syntrophales bacterium]|nr:secretin and TonB N-terminal domain-containing protein [Syntrophales bacterium]
MKGRQGILYGLAAAAGFILLGSCSGGSGITSTPARGLEPTETAVVQKVGEASALLTEIIFHRSAGREEVTLAFSAIPEDIDLSQPSDNIVALTMKNTVMGEGIRERYTPERLYGVKTVSLRTVAGTDQPALGVAIELSDIVPYRMRRSDSAIIISFDTAAIHTGLAPPAALREDDTMEAYLAKEALMLWEEEPDADYRGERLSIICQDAHIKNVFRLISEVSGYNIVAGPDVDQKVTLHMRNVPWDQALETILEVNELGMTTRGRVITVMPRKKMEVAEEQRLAKNVAEGRVRQVSIEARIVEVNTSFSRDLGIRWGVGTTAVWGPGNSRDVGILFGSAGPTNSTVTTLPNNIGLTNSNIAVNFPSATGAVMPALGIIAGSSRWVLDAKLQALEEVGDGKIISSPKVTTVDKVKATISQGEEFDVQITGADGELTTKTIRAILSLDVTPQITAEGKLSLDIEAQNRYADWTRAGDGGIVGPPIMASEVQSKVVISDGDTIVIGGIYKSEDTSGGSGIPWLSSIPVLGWLFKERTIRKTQMELLIFITPVILGEVITRG